VSGADPLSALLAIEEAAFAATTPSELGFIMVNQTRDLLAYDQAALHLTGKGVRALSGVSSLEARGPYVLWLQAVFRGKEDKDEIPEREARDWAAWLPEHALWLPLVDGAGRRLGTLLLVRADPWDDASSLLGGRLALAYGVALRALGRSGSSRGLALPLARPRWIWALPLVLAGVMLVPTRLSVLAPAEVVARNAAVVRAPLEGVIETISARPNQPVTKGEPLFEFDGTTTRGRMEVAARALESALAELDQVTQEAFIDPEAKARLAVIKARVEERRAELAQSREILARALVVAPRDGVTVMDDPSEWEGRPVTVGEKVMAIADPTQVEVEAWLSPADAIVLENGAPVTLFLNSDPLNPITARLSYVAYEATESPDGILAHRVRATIDDPDVTPESAPRLGLRGTARLDGDRVPLAYWLFRRPLGVVRQWLGW
jgi:multidrug efflux pump subunit AcrA (membrane-fusion protein)